MELMRLIGARPDIQQASHSQVTMRSYKLPGGTEPLRTWNIVEHFEPTPACPYVRQSTELFFKTLPIRSVGPSCSRSRHHGGHTSIPPGTTRLFRRTRDRVAGLRTRRARSHCTHICRKDDAENRETVKTDFLVGADGAKGQPAWTIPFT